MARSRLLVADGTKSQGRPLTERNAIMTVGKIAPRPAFRLLTLVLLIFALVDLVPATGLWRITVGALISLPLLWLMAVWIGGIRIPQFSASATQADGAASLPLREGDPSIIR
jgi:hypothetical protein